jgi:translation initiation factor 1
MVEICSTCGLPKDICVCDTISREQQKIRVFVEYRKWRRPATIIEGVDGKSTDIRRMAQKLKTLCACGGATKRDQIILQGDHREKLRHFLIDLGFPDDNIEISDAPARPRGRR